LKDNTNYYWTFF